MSTGGYGGLLRYVGGSIGWLGEPNVNIDGGIFYNATFFEKDGFTWMLAMHAQTGPGTHIGRHALYRENGAGWTLMTEDVDFNVRFTAGDVKPGAVCAVPWNGAVTFGYLGHDTWGRWHPTLGWEQGSDHGGSCVFAVETWDGRVISGDYEYAWGFTYSSPDGLTYTIEDPDAVRSTDLTNTSDRYAEVWKMVKRNNALYAFTCVAGGGNSAHIMRLNQGATKWTSLYHTVLPTHIGFTDAIVDSSGRLVTCCGSEPYYYGFQSYPNSAVYVFTPSGNFGTLDQIGDTPWRVDGAQVYIVRDLSLRPGHVPLRQYPRDDGWTGSSAPRQYPTPTSSIRQGWQNRIR